MSRNITHDRPAKRRTAPRTKSPQRKSRAVRPRRTAVSGHSAIPNLIAQTCWARDNDDFETLERFYKDTVTMLGDGTVIASGGKAIVAKLREIDATQPKGLTRHLTTNLS